MNYYGMNKLIEDSMLYEKIVSKVKKSLVNDLKYGYYVTCISDVKGKHLVEKQYEKAVSKGTRWLVSPVEHIKDIDYTVRNTHEYRLFFVRKKITPSQIVGELHLTEGSIVVSGAVLKKCFVAGFLSKRDLLSSKNSVRVSKNNTGIRPHKYYAYTHGAREEFAAEDTLEELFDTLHGKGINHVHTTNESGEMKIIKFPQEEDILRLRGKKNQENKRHL